MIAGLPLSFAEPLLLLGLLSLPLLWWLLRVMPPRPRRIEFPPTRLLFDIAPKEETPSRTPWWLTALRLLAAAQIAICAGWQRFLASSYPRRTSALNSHDSYQAGPLNGIELTRSWTSYGGYWTPACRERRAGRRLCAPLSDS